MATRLEDHRAGPANDPVRHDVHWPGHRTLDERRHSLDNRFQLTEAAWAERYVSRDIWPMYPLR